MHRKIAQAGWIVFSLAFFIAGLSVLLRSVKMGLHAAHVDIVAAGGMDTEEYRLRMASYIESYRWVGGILLVAGCLGLLFKVDIGRLTVGLATANRQHPSDLTADERRQAEAVSEEARS